MSKRIQRINQLLKEEISQILLRELEFNGAMVTITDVDASANLQQAKVKITVLPQSQEKNALRILNKNLYEIQQILNRKLNMRPVPRISFEIDEAAKRGYEVDRLLGEISK